MQYYHWTYTTIPSASTDFETILKNDLSKYALPAATKTRKIEKTLSVDRTVQFCIFLLTLLCFRAYS